MRLNKILDEMSARDLHDAEMVIEYLFKDLKLDVVWTTHFKERIMGREEGVSKEELIDSFRRMKQKYGDLLTRARDDQQQFTAVLKDISHELNIPFAVDFSRKYGTKYILRGITIMRKSNFHNNAEGGVELRV
jgi:hypothetical protein